MCVGLGLSPEYFWRMPLGEVWWFIRAKRPDLFIGPDNPDEWADLYALLESD